MFLIERGQWKGDATVDTRTRQVVEQITGDSSLTDDVNDSEGIRLLNWGTAHARRLVMYTFEMDDYAAEEYLEAQIPNLRRVIRRTNKLVAAASAATVEEIATRLQALLEAAQQVPVITPQPPDDFQAAAQTLQSLPPDAVLTELLAYLSLESATDDTQ